MPTQTFKNALAIAERVPNVVGDSIYESPGPARVLIYQTADADDIDCTINFGSRTVVPRGPITQAETAGRGPKTNEDLVVDDVVLFNEKVLIELNGGAAATDVRTRIVVMPA